MRRGLSLAVGAILVAIGVAGFAADSERDDPAPWHLQKVAKFASGEPTAEPGKSALSDERSAYLHLSVKFRPDLGPRKMHEFCVTGKDGQTVASLFGFHKDRSLLVFEGDWKNLKGLFLEGMGHREPLIPAATLRPAPVADVPGMAADRPIIVSPESKPARPPIVVEPGTRPVERVAPSAAPVVPNSRIEMGPSGRVTVGSGRGAASPRRETIVEREGPEGVGQPAGGRWRTATADRTAKVGDRPDEDRETMSDRPSRKADGERPAAANERPVRSLRSSDSSSAKAGSPGRRGDSGAGSGAGGGKGGGAGPGSGAGSEGDSADDKNAGTGKDSGKGKGDGSEKGDGSGKDASRGAGTGTAKGTGTGRSAGSQSSAGSGTGSAAGAGTGSGMSAGSGTGAGSGVGSVAGAGASGVGAGGGIGAGVGGAGLGRGRYGRSSGRTGTDRSAGIAPRAGALPEAKADSPDEPRIAARPGGVAAPVEADGAGAGGGIGSMGGGAGLIHLRERQDAVEFRATQMIFYFSCTDDMGRGRIYQVDDKGVILGLVTLPYAATGLALHRQPALAAAVPRQRGKIFHIDMSGKVSLILEDDPRLPQPVDVGIAANSDSIVVADNLAHVLAGTSITGQKLREVRRLNLLKWDRPLMSVAVTLDNHVLFATDMEPGVYRYPGNDFSARPPLLPTFGGVAADATSPRWAAAQAPNQVVVYEGETPVKTLRLPPGHNLYRHGLLSFAPAGRVVVAAQSGEKPETVWIVCLETKDETALILFPWKKEPILDFVVGPRMPWEPYVPDKRRSLY